MAVVSCWTTDSQMESVGKLYWLVLVTINYKIPAYEGKDTIVERRLSIKGHNLVLEIGHVVEFAQNLLYALELLTFVAHHRLFSVK